MSEWKPWCCCILQYKSVSYKLRETEGLVLSILRGLIVGTMSMLTVRLAEKEGNLLVDLDQCMFGLKDPENKKLYRKATMLLTNNEYMEKYLGRKCDQEHEHQRLEGKVKLGGQWYNRTRCAQKNG